jgi:hypothetical protein
MHVGVSEINAGQILKELAAPRDIRFFSPLDLLA